MKVKDTREVEHRFITKLQRRVSKENENLQEGFVLFTFRIMSCTRIGMTTGRFLFRRILA